MLLLVGAAVCALLAVWAVGAAFGRSWTPWLGTSLRAGAATRTLVLAVVVAVLVLLVWLVLRGARESLWLPLGNGGLLVPAADVEARLAEAAERHPDVLRAEARLRSNGGTPGAGLRLVARPLADAPTLEAEVVAAVARELTAITGLASGPVAAKARVVSVHRLPRYLA